MKKCPYCGTELANDNLFCTECGKQIPQGKVCSNCGATVSEDDIFCANCGKEVDVKSTEIQIEENSHTCPYCGTIIHDGDAFCQNCGKTIVKEPVPTSSMHSHDAGTSRNDVEVQVNGINDTEEYNYSVEDETRTWRGIILYIVGAVVIIGVLGAVIWNYYSSSQRAEKNIALADSLEKVRKDSVLQVRQQEKAKQDSIYKVQQEEKEFLENFYKNLNYSEWEILSYYIRKNVTSNALQTLREEYDYDCDDGDCLALWLFSYEAGGDMDKLIERKIEAVSENTFLVTNTWGYSDGPATRCDYKVKLSIVKEGDSYKIDTIVNLMEEEREKTYRENSNQYSKYVGRWILRKTTDEGQKMLIEVILKENHNGEFAVFHDRGSVQDVIAYEVYTQCILSDGIIYMTKDGDINKDVPKLRIASDGLYSFDGGKYERQSE